MCTAPQVEYPTYIVLHRITSQLRSKGHLWLHEQVPFFTLIHLVHPGTVVGIYRLQVGFRSQPSHIKPRSTTLWPPKAVETRDGAFSGATLHFWESPPQGGFPGHLHRYSVGSKKLFPGQRTCFKSLLPQRCFNYYGHLPPRMPLKILEIWLRFSITFLSTQTA